MAENRPVIEVVDENKKTQTAYSLPQGLQILGEEDFQTAMRGPGREWREAEVEAGDFTGHDGSKLRYYFAIPAGAKATIVMVHGFCEFWGKYHEMAWYFHQAGYGFFFLEQRGHGYSDREVERLDLVHLDHYGQYVEDLHLFVEKVVIPANGDRHLYLLAHSMGGAVGALFLEEYSGYFEKAILSSPMLDMKTGNISKPVISAYMIYLKAAGKLKDLSANQKYFDGKPAFETSSCLSRARYDYQFDQRLADEHYQTYGATFGWVGASLAANRQLLRKAKKVTIPVLMFVSGMDHLVNREGQMAFAERSSDTRVVEYRDAKHEIFNSLEFVRTDYYSRIFDFFSQGQNCSTG